MNDVTDIILKKLESMDTKIDNISTAVTKVTTKQDECSKICLPKVDNIEEKQDSYGNRLTSLETKLIVVWGILVIFLPVIFTKYLDFVTSKEEKPKTEQIQRYDRDANAWVDKDKKIVQK